MPVVDEEQMEDEVFLAVRTAWDAGAESAGLLIGYEGVHNRPSSGLEAGSTTRPKSWCWVSILPVEGKQATFGRAPNRRFASTALFTAQIFAPESDGRRLALRLGTIVREALEDMKTAGGVIADEVTPNPIGREKRTWYRYDVLATLRYWRIR